MSNIRDTLLKLLVDRAAATGHGASVETLHKLADEIRTAASNDAAPGDGSRPKINGRRWDHEVIEQHIPAGASVLDLGCGDGSLLARLMRTKGIHPQGVEIDAEAVLDCVTNGVPVFQANLDEGLAGFPDQGFDYVVLEETIQTLVRPRTVLSEMVRVGKLGIVTFPNFGYWQVRLDLALTGRMPVTKTLPFDWWETPNIRLLTLNDFRAWTDDEGIEIVETHIWADSEVRPPTEGDNLFAEEVMMVIRRTDA